MKHTNSPRHQLQSTAVRKKEVVKKKDIVKKPVRSHKKKQTTYPRHQLQSVAVLKKEVVKNKDIVNKPAKKKVVKKKKKATKKSTAEKMKQELVDVGDGQNDSDSDEGKVVVIDSDDDGCGVYKKIEKKAVKTSTDKMVVVKKEPVDVQDDVNNPDEETVKYSDGDEDE